MLKEVEQLNPQLKGADDKLQDACSKIQLLQDGRHEPYVISSYEDGRYHVTNAYLDLATHAWRCKCGWDYGKSQFRRSMSIPASVPYHNLCKRCLREERKLRKARYVGVRRASSDSN